MISSTTSPTSSFGLRLAVTIIISIGNLCMLIAMCTNHWIQVKGEDYVGYVGLWKVCITGVCMAHSEFVYSKILLVIAIIFGISCNIVAILALLKGLKYVKYLVARAMFITGLLALCGMAPATVVLTRLLDFDHIEYGLVFGWISVVLYYVAGFMSWIHSRIEPDIAMTMDEIRQLISSSRTSYTGIP